MSTPIQANTTREYQVHYRYYGRSPWMKSANVWSRPFEVHEIRGEWDKGVEWSALCRVCLN